MCLSTHKGDFMDNGERLFTRFCSDSTRSNGFQLKDGRFWWDIRKNFFPVKVVRCWNTLPKQAADTPSLEGFKARLDRGLKNPA